MGKDHLEEDELEEFDDDEKVVREKVWPLKEMVESSFPTPPAPEKPKKTFQAAAKKIFKIVQQQSLDKREVSNILEGLANHPRSGVREVKSEILVEDDVFAKTTTVITKEKTEKATGLVPKKIEVKPFTKAELSARTINEKKLRLWGGGSTKKVVKQGPKIKPPEIKIEANLIHWQTEQNEKIAISSVDKRSVFSAEDIAANQARRVEKEKKKTEELFQLEEKKKEREKVAKEQMPLVWDGAEWVFEDEFAKKKEEARIKREEALLAEQIERERRKKEEEERKKREEQEAAAKKLALDAAKFLEEEEAKQIQKEKITVYGSQAAKIDKFEKGEEEEKQKISEEMFMTEEQLAEKKKKFDELQAKTKADEDARMKKEEELLAEQEEIEKRKQEGEEERLKGDEGRRQQIEEDLARIKEEEEAARLEEEEEKRKERERVSEEFDEKYEKLTEEQKLLIKPKKLKTKGEGESDGESEEESSDDEDTEWGKKPKKE